MEKSKVSVIVPVYNQKRYLDSCIRSICNQTYKNLEIIVINDGSTDDTLNRLKRIAESDERIKVYDKQNEGVAYARRDGLLRSTGEFVTFADNDDLLPTDAVQTMVGYILKEKVDLVIGRFKRFLGFVKWNGFNSSFPVHTVISQPELFENYYGSFFGEGSFPINVWGRLYRKSAIDGALQKTELYSPEIRCLADDLYMNMKLFPYLRSMYMTDEVVYYYRYGGTVDHFNRNYPEVFTVSDKRFEMLQQQRLDKYYGSLFEEYVNMVYYHALQLLMFKKGDRDSIIAFFENELNNRKLVPCLMKYYAQNKTDKESVTLLVNHNYEGMFNHALGLMKQLSSSPLYKTKRIFLSLLERLA